MHYLLYAKKIV